MNTLFIYYFTILFIEKSVISKTIVHISTGGLIDNLPVSNKNIVNFSLSNNGTVFLLWLRTLTKLLIIMN